MQPSKLFPLALIAVMAPAATAGEEPYGKGMTEANKERLVLDDMEDVSDWYNGSRAETTISASERHVKHSQAALLFANLVDHTKGEKNYPVGWPRTGKNLASEKLTDWSSYDFFECWIYAETSRTALPKTPLGVGFYHSGQKRSSHIRLGEVKKDAWVRIVIPIDRLLEPTDVQRVQFNISESDYKHGDRVDFFIDDPVLTRFVDPAVAQVSLGRKILFSHDRSLIAQYKLVGYRDLEKTKVELAIGRGDDPPAARTDGSAARVGELVLRIKDPLTTGEWWAALRLLDAAGRLIDRDQVAFRVVTGPFGEE